MMSPVHLYRRTANKTLPLTTPRSGLTIKQSSGLYENPHFADKIARTKKESMTCLPGKRLPDGEALTRSWLDIDNGEPAQTELWLIEQIASGVKGNLQRGIRYLQNPSQTRAIRILEKNSNKSIKALLTTVCSR